MTYCNAHWTGDTDWPRKIGNIYACRRERTNDGGCQHRDAARQPNQEQQ